MVKRYKILKVEEPIHKELVRIKALMQLRDGKSYTYSEVIESMIALLPKIDIEAVRTKR